MTNNELKLDELSSISAAKKQIGNYCLKGYENKTQKKTTSTPQAIKQQYIKKHHDDNNSSTLVIPDFYPMGEW